MQSNNKKSSHLGLDIFILIVILAIVTACWYFFWQWIDLHIISESQEKTNQEVQGQFGDKFGAINSLFSALAFAAIIFTILLQNRELNNTKKAMEKQNDTVNSQRFDSTFFQLIHLHNEITGKLNDLPNSGRQAFLSFQESIIQSDPEYKSYFGLNKLTIEEIRKIKDNRANNIKSLSEDQKKYLSGSDISNIELLLEDGVSFCESHLDEALQRHEEKIRKAYTKAATNHIDKYSHYFRNLYHILRFIKESDLISESDKKSYIKIVRSQLSEIELVAIFYNSLTEIKIPHRDNLELGYPKMGKLLVEFDILQNMGNSNIIHPSHKKIFENNNKDK